MDAITIIQDLDPPKIINFYPENGGRYHAKDIKKIKIDVDDFISGIEPEEKSFNLKINDTPLYPAYQPIKKQVSYTFDQSLNLGQHKIEFNVIDRLENESNKIIYFVIIK